MQQQGAGRCSCGPLNTSWAIAVFNTDPVLCAHDPSHLVCACCLPFWILLASCLSPHVFTWPVLKSLLKRHKNKTESAHNPVSSPEEKNSQNKTHYWVELLDLCPCFVHKHTPACNHFMQYGKLDSITAFISNPHAPFPSSSLCSYFNASVGQEHTDTATLHRIADLGVLWNN